MSFPGVPPMPGPMSLRGVPRPGQDGVPPSRPVWGYPTSELDGGIHHPSGNRAAERVLAVQWAACLLRSRRRTFLLVFVSVDTDPKPMTLFLQVQQVLKNKNYFDKPGKDCLAKNHFYVESTVATVTVLRVSFHWWLVRGTLLMESGLLRDFFGNFSMRGERCYFCMEGHMRWMQDENCYTR